jgi:hypothetical protein
MSAANASERFASAARALREQSGQDTSQLEAAHAAAVEEAVVAARCQVIEKAAVRFAKDRDAEVAEAVAAATVKCEQQRLAEKSAREAEIRQLREELEASLHICDARIAETEERVRAQEREVMQKAVIHAETEATVRIQAEHHKAREAAVRHAEEKERAVEAAIARTHDEATRSVGEQYENRLSRLLAGIAESDAAHEARNTALRVQLCEANEALKVTLDRLTAHKQPKR